jgi:hypothetical protein
MSLTEEYNKKIGYQNKLKSNKVIIEYTPEEINYLSNPMGYASYNSDSSKYCEKNNTRKIKHKRELFFKLDDIINDEEKSPDIILQNTGKKGQEGPPKIPKRILYPEKNPSDRLKCEICGTIFSRSNRFNHRQTKKHKIYAEINSKLLKIMRSDLD